MGKFVGAQPIIAIIDSGIDTNNAFLKKTILGGISITIDENGQFKYDEDYNDENGHGTLSASVIIKECPIARLFIIKILDKNCIGNLKLVEESLRFIMNTNIEIINMSFSIISDCNLSNLNKICKKLYKQNRILVASEVNGNTKSFPASFRSVLGVKGFILESDKDYWFSRLKRIQCVVDNNSYIHHDIGNTFQLYGKCNSFAAAKMSGIIANILKDSYQTDYKCVLKKHAQKKKWNSSDFKESKRFPVIKFQCDPDEDEKIFNEIIELLIKFTGNDNKIELINKPLFSIGIDKLNCYRLIQRVEAHFGINIPDYRIVSRYDLFSAYTLSKFVEGIIYGKEKCI